MEEKGQRTPEEQEALRKLRWERKQKNKEEATRFVKENPNKKK